MSACAWTSISCDEPGVATGLGFFDHMLEQLGKHGGFALALQCEGDTHVDEHHTVEDCALALGEALRRALGDKRGIARYGFSLPMDEARPRTRVWIFPDAPYFVFEGSFPRERVGEVPTELVPHFFRSLCDALGANLHLSVRGDNAHHMVEACFKVVARALRQAIRREGDALPSTKGSACMKVVLCGCRRHQHRFGAVCVAAPRCRRCADIRCRLQSVLPTR